MRETLETIFELIKNDLDMALASNKQDPSEGYNQEEEKLKEQLRDEVTELKRRHAQVLGSMRGY